jgi:UDP-N-acetylmuramoyl-tripeptide--D-alanyl-D-alanine ligase
MNLLQIADVLKVETTQNLLFTGFSVDTRLVKPGNLFFALKGAQTDGHAHLQEAQKKGTIAAVVNKDYSGSDYGLLLLKVEDPLIALQTLSKEKIRSLPAKIVAITGSVGKTTTKDFTTTLLKEKYRVGSLTGNQNSQIGLPLGILNNDFTNKDVIILEMGMDAAGQITKLTQIAPPDVSIVTATTLQHGKNFDSIEGIGRAKAEIFSHPKTQFGLISADIVNYEELNSLSSCPKISFSTKQSNANYYLEENPAGFTIRDFSGSASFEPFHILGKHNLHNFLAAATIARCLELTWDEIRQEIPKLQLPERRLQILQLKGVTFVNDSYNACEVSMNAALENLPLPNKGGKKIACLGEMGELGHFSEKCHQAVGKKALENVDIMLCLGEGCKPIVECWSEAGREVFHFNDRLKLVDKLRELVNEGDCVLLKGSRSKQMWKVIEEL